MIEKNIYKGGRSKHFIVCSLNESCRKYAFNQANNVSWKRTEGKSEHIDCKYLYNIFIIMVCYIFIKSAECRAYNRSRKEFGMRLPPVKNKIPINSLFCKKLVYKKLVQQTVNKYAGFQFWFQEAGERKCYYYCFDLHHLKEIFMERRRIRKKK